MKILFTCLSMNKGGAERVISVLANKFIKQHEVTIVTLVKSEPEYNLNKQIKIIEVDKTDFLYKLKTIGKILLRILPNRLIGLYKVIKAQKPDVIISFLPEPSLRIMLIKKLSKDIKSIPTIVSVRNDPNIEYKNKFIYYAMKKLYKNADALVLQTEESKEYFEKIIKDKEKLTIIPNPINENFIVDEPYKGKREKTIVIVGRLEPQKNHKLLIDAFKNVIETQSEYKLLIYGDGSLKNELEEYTKKLGLSNNIIFKGKKDNIKEEIYNAGMFVLSSNYEGMPNALMEAMALGLPCISTDCPCGGPKTLINNNVNGILVKVNDVNEMSKAIKFLIENPNISQQISFEANKIKETYAIDKIKEEWIKCIEGLKKV